MNKEHTGRLILSRKTGEKIRIGKSIIVEIVDVRGSRARLAIQAPQPMRVMREEKHAQRCD